MTVHRKACIAGIYEHPTRRADGLSTAHLHADVALGALADAALSLQDVDGFFCAEAGLQRHPIGDEEVLDRLILPMINEGAKRIDEGMVARAGDIDVVWHKGYGWPDWKGGPMYHADMIGIRIVRDGLRSLAQVHGERFRPAALLDQLAGADGRFCS